MGKDATKHPDQKFSNGAFAALMVCLIIGLVLFGIGVAVCVCIFTTQPQLSFAPAISQHYNDGRLACHRFLAPPTLLCQSRSYSMAHNTLAHQNHQLVGQSQFLVLHQSQMRLRRYCQNSSVSLFGFPVVSGGVLIASGSVGIRWCVPNQHCFNIEPQLLFALAQQTQAFLCANDKRCLR